MKKKHGLSLIVICITITGYFVNCAKSVSIETKIKQRIIDQTKQLEQYVADSLLVDYENLASSGTMQQRFLKARHLYKKTEWAIAYFMPHTERFMNGPALDEIEIEEHTAFSPEGFQVVEEIIFPETDTARIPELKQQLISVVNHCKNIVSQFETIEITQNQICDAIHLQLLRNISLGMSGFDSPVALNSINELVTSLEEAAELARICQKWFLTDSEAYIKLLTQLSSAAEFCTNNTRFDQFDRAVFILDFINPICKNFKALVKENNIGFETDQRAFRADGATFWDSLAFNPNAFSGNKEDFISAEKIVLGKQMFFSKVLSQQNNMSCASCHQPEKAFTDGLEKSIGLHGLALERNTPSLNYAAWQHGQFWDMRQTDLESQALQVIQSKEEMHGSLAVAAKNLEHSEHFRAFKHIFKTDTIAPWYIQNVLASYIRSLSVFSSKFDRVMRHETLFTQTEKQGFNLFMGKAKCGTCHFVPFFNGTIPPRFVKSESEVLGVPYLPDNKKIDGDMGRYKHTGMPQLLRSFKTPTVRNIMLTAPYMHNGVYKTLEEVLEFYNQGGGNGLGFNIDNQTLPTNKLDLTPAEIASIIAFMNTLTDS